jgi:hypothetical protein
MRRIILLMILGMILIFANCANNATSKTDKSIKIQEPAKSRTDKSIKNSDLLSLFKEIQFDTLHIWAKSKKADGDKFQGKMIDTIYFPLFGDYISQYKQYYTDPKTKIKKYSGYYLFASYKFSINDYLTGLIMREPSQYEESAIGLWIYNSKADELYKSVRLADAFGDENWYFKKDSWIQKNKSGFRIISRQLDHEINETTSVDSITSDKFGFSNFSTDKFLKVDTFEINRDDYKLFDEK